MRVTLIEASNPCVVLLAVKTSAGRLNYRPVGKYYPDCDIEKLRRWMIEASREYQSVLEHVKLTFLVEGVSRVLSHQLVRHRIASYTQESLRYSSGPLETMLVELCRYYDVGEQLCKDSAPELVEDALNKLASYMVLEDEDICGKDCREYIADLAAVVEKAFVIPPTVKGDPRALASYIMGVLSAYASYSTLTAHIPQEDARYVLPMSIKTRILVTVNLRQFIHMYCQRTGRKAQWEIQELFHKMMEELEKRIPWIRDMIHCH